MAQNPKSAPLQDRIRGIKAIAFDIDGVLTDGSLIPLSDGDLLRVVDAKDAFAMRVASNKGLVTAIISGGDTKALRIRCQHSGVKDENIHLGVRGKIPVFAEFCRSHGITPAECAYFGDDISDTQVMKACGVSFAPADAVPEAKAAADVVTTRPGGKGCVREGIELILKSQGLWVFDEEHYELLW